jgi:hypothetical protein
MMSPRYQIRTLYSAAGVLARRGDEVGCESVLTNLQTLYDEYVADLKRAGVEPGEVASWRQQRIISAQSVNKLRTDALERGGFWGIGEDYIAVPWKAFKATPGANSVGVGCPGRRTRCSTTVPTFKSRNARRSAKR